MTIEQGAAEDIARTAPTGVPPRTTRPRRRSRPKRGLWVPSVSVGLTVLLLELLIRADVVESRIFPPPSTIGRRLIEELGGSTLWRGIGDTLVQAGTGLAIGTAFAVLIGLLLGTVPVLEHALNPIIEFVRPIPSIAILPLVILSLGVGFRSAVLLVSLSSFFLVLVMTIQGARSVDPLTRDAMKVFGLNAVQRFYRVTLPSATPAIATGIRIAGAVSIIVAITTELVGGIPGLGRLVMQSELGGDRVGMFTYTVVAGVLGLVVNIVLEAVESRFLGWHASQRTEA